MREDRFTRKKRRERERKEERGISNFFSFLVFVFVICNFYLVL